MTNTNTNTNQFDSPMDVQRYYEGEHNTKFWRHDTCLNIRIIKISEYIMELCKFEARIMMDSANQYISYHGSVGCKLDILKDRLKYWKSI